MPHSIRNRLHVRGLKVGPLFLGGLTLAVALSACSNDRIVYPNRNLRAAMGGETGESGAAGEAGEAGTDTGGAAHGGSGGAGAAGGGKGGGGGSGGKAGSGGGSVVGPVCGDGKLEAPEECDDGNNRSGDGCSWDCRTACEICEQNVCPQYETEGQIPESAYDSCYRGMGKINKGPAAGYLRSQVCQELVDCIRQESCAQVKNGVLRAQRCFCDLDWTPPNGPTASACGIDPDPSNPKDPTKFIPGKCASLFQDASENTALKDVIFALAAADVAEGRAIRLFSQCDARICPEECVADYLGAGPIATISADVVAERNAAGESPLGDLVADSQRVVAGADFALVAPSFIALAAGDQVDLLVAPTAYRAADAAGRVLWSEAVAVSYGYRSLNEISGQSANPQANLDMYKVTFTGAQIYEALRQQFNPSLGGLLFVSGLRYTYTWNASSPAASTIGEVRKTDGTLLDQAATYTVSLSQFLTDAKSPVPVLGTGTNATLLTGVVAFELLGQYMKGLAQPVAPPELNRITRLN